MESNENLKAQLSELFQEINGKRRFGVDCSLELQKADEIEKYLIEDFSKRLNDDYINSHEWKEIHTSSARKWDLIIHNNIVCRVLEMNSTNYNPGSDTFNYEAKINGIFIDYESSIEFGYYDKIKILNQWQSKRNQ